MFFWRTIRDFVKSYTLLYNLHFYFCIYIWFWKKLLQQLHSAFLACKTVAAVGFSCVTVLFLVQFDQIVEKVAKTAHFMIFPRSPAVPAGFAGQSMSTVGSSINKKKYRSRENPVPVRKDAWVCCCLSSTTTIGRALPARPVFLFSLPLPYLG